jgi:hypothetical protein
MNFPWHAQTPFSADEWISVIAIVTMLAWLIGNRFTGRGRLAHANLPTLAWMALVWVGIIVAAALAFQHFRPGGFGGTGF